MIDLAQPAEPAVDVILRDGTTLRLRPPTEADVHGVMAFFADLSVRSRFLRFHGFTVAGDRFVRSFVEPDWAERGSLIGVMGDAADERVVGVGNYVRLRDPQSAEAAFAVADEFQGKGIGTRLLEQLAQRAAAHGIGAFIAEVLPENNTMLSVFANAGFVPTRTLEGGVIEVRFPIEATEGYRARVDERDHVAVTASLRPFFEPRTVAVIGASARRGSIGGELFRNVLAGGFTGAAYPSTAPVSPSPGCAPTVHSRRSAIRSTFCVISLPGDLVLRRRRGSASLGDALAVRHLGGLRRDRPRGRRAPGTAADARARPRRAPRRAQLPRDRNRGAEATVQLHGYLELGERCDAQRALAQLTETALQFPTSSASSSIWKGSLCRASWPGSRPRPIPCSHRPPSPRERGAATDGVLLSPPLPGVGRAMGEGAGG